MENPLVYIVRGLPKPLDSSVAKALAQYLEPGGRSPRDVLSLLDAARKLMVPRPEYDLGDFRHSDVIEALDLLAAGDEELWAQLLHALDDVHSPEFKRLKRLSPYAQVYLMFLDDTGDAAKLRAELDDELAEEFLRRADAHNFPGNYYAVIVPPEALEMMRFVAASDDVPATA